MAKDKYALAGVNVKEGDSISQFAGGLCRSTYGNSPFVEIRDFSHGHFRGPRGFRPKNLPFGAWFDIAPDGDGTKVVLVDAAGDYRNASRGFVAMTNGDITRWGGMPVLSENILEVRSVGKRNGRINKAIRGMLLGLKLVADEQGFVLYKGELAELGPFVGSDNDQVRVAYLWSGVSYGVYHDKLMITGDRLKEGMIIMALREDGFRNNGMSLVRRVLKMQLGRDVYSNPKFREIIAQAAAPAILYDKFLVAANGWYTGLEPIIQMYLIVHLTGGGIRSKLGEDILFPRGFSAYLDDLWEPSAVMKQVSQWGNLSGKDCYSSLNGGQGALVVIKEDDVDRFKMLAKTYGIDARPAGRVIKESSPRVTIISKFDGSIVKFAA